jgi:hypothetical protein
MAPDVARAEEFRGGGTARTLEQISTSLAHVVHPCGACPTSLWSGRAEGTAALSTASDLV